MHNRAAQLAAITAALETVTTRDVVRNEAGAIIGITERITDTDSLIARGQNLVRGMKARHEVVPDHGEWLAEAVKFMRAWAAAEKRRANTEKHDELVTLAAGLEGIAEVVTDGGIAANVFLTDWVN
jgi:hypothetical protein